MEDTHFSNILKYTFLFSGLVALLLGLTFVFMTEFYLSITAWPYYDPFVSRILGAALLGLWLIKWLSFREKEWEKVKNIVIMIIF
ncbi:MAG: hypothetical protein GF383_05635 [Candidatus Lokiarchaeota archaeon]|nr:hypothetical protein [Candidatus Lokiarchaeota archaeon]MBD3339412.1 hypothetical protein [Candidatus Lokiarchaeota archaeon]